MFFLFHDHAQLALRWRVGRDLFWFRFYEYMSFLSQIFIRLIYLDFKNLLSKKLRFCSFSKQVRKASPFRLFFLFHDHAQLALRWRVGRDLFWFRFYEYISFLSQIFIRLIYLYFKNLLSKKLCSP